jgi:hypothetical protein
MPRGRFIPHVSRRSRSRPRHSNRDFVMRKPSSCPSHNSKNLGKTCSAPPPALIVPKWILQKRSMNASGRLWGETRYDVAALGPRIDTNQRPDAVADEA